MEANIFTILKVDIEAQMSLIQTTFDRLEARAANLSPEKEAQLESAAYQLHNLYNAVEDLLKLVATHFENQISDAARWHTALLQRMTQTIPGVRPAFLSADSFRLLNSLRGFRHFFRHAYAAPIEYAQLQLNLDKARRLRATLTTDANRFLAALKPQR